MALPRITELVSLDFAYDGEPFVSGPATALLNLSGMDVAYDGQPYVGNDGPVLPTSFEEDLALADSTVATATVPISEAVALADSETLKASLSIDEPLATSDAEVQNVTISTEEDVNLVDDTTATIPGKVIWEEDLPIGEATSLLPTESLAESVALSDVETTNITISDAETIGVLDSSTLNLKIPFEEDLGMAEVPALSIRFTETLPIADSEQVYVDFYQQYSMTVSITEYIDRQFSMEAALDVFAVQPVTDYTSPSNPFAPTIITGGVILTENPVTKPANWAIAQTYIGLAGSALIPNMCSLYNFNINLAVGTPGTFSFTSSGTLGNLNDSLTIAGLPAVISNVKEVMNNGAQGFITSGYFGPRIMSKQLLLQIIGAANSAGVVPDQYLQQPPSIQWTTLSTAANAIARVAGIYVRWYAPDFPLTDLFFETGMTVYEALNALAGRVGAFVCWDGYLTYRVIRPDKPIGSNFTIPDCHLIGPGGLEIEKILDISGVIGFPVGAIYDTGIKVTDSALAPAPAIKVESKASITKKLDVGNLPILIEFPGDVDKIKERWIVSGANVGATPNTTSLQLIQNSNIADVWFDSPFQFSSPTSNTFRDSTGKKILAVNSSYFTAHNALNDGEFTLEIGYTRKTDALEAARKQAFEEGLSKQRTMISYQQERLRLFKKKAGTANLLFHGAIPLPGGLGSFSVGGSNISGMIETVSLQWPGFLNVTLGEYTKLSYMTPKATLDYFSATGEATGF